MIDAIKNFFKGYVDFSGRSTRPDYWWIGLANIILAIPFYIVYGSAIANPDSEAAVMNVVYESYYTDKEKNKNYSQDEFKIFIYLVNKEVIEIDGDEGVGNGEYGSGFWVTVTR